MNRIGYRCRQVRGIFASSSLACAFLLVALPTQLQAATIDVDTNNDELTVDGDCSLREAIEAANTDTAVDMCAAGSGPDTINIPAGMYALKVMGDDDVNLRGDLDVTSDIVLQGAGASTTQILSIIDERLLHVLPGATVELHGLALQDGAAPAGTDNTNMGGAGTDGAHGGAILNTGTLTIVNCVLANNRAGRGGNGDVAGGAGGAGGAIYSTGTLIITDTTLQSNDAGRGGSAGPATAFDGANGGDGGAIYSTGSLTVARVTLDGNNAGDGGAGGFSGVAGAGGAGGGIYQSGGDLTVDSSTLSANTAGSGESTAGGAALYAMTMGTIVNSTISGNSADENGALHAAAGSTLTLSHSTVVDNTAPGLEGTLSVRNTIVLGNTSDGMNYGDCAGSVTSDGFNLVGAGTGCPSGAAGDQTTASADALVTVLDVLSDNGGPTQTHLVPPTSPALDNGVCTDSGGMTVSVDQRGAPRPGGAECEVGAYEAADIGQGGPPVLIEVTVEPAGNNCTDGGQKIEVGEDFNSNGILDPSEIETTAYVCNGVDGNDGNDGNDGPEGRMVLVETTAEAAGSNCENGGLAIEAGVDNNRNGQLEPEEVQNTTYVCNGTNGNDGTDGANSLILQTPVAAGSLECPEGGSRIDVGIDNNGNGALNEDEIESTMFICQPESGGCRAGGQGAGPGLLLLVLLTLLARRRERA